MVDVDTSITMSASRISNNMKLPLDDSIILATSSIHDAVVWTQDSDFEGIESVKYRKKNDKK